MGGGRAASQQDLYFIDIDHGRPAIRAVKDFCPCLTRTRAGAQGFWVSTRGRVISHSEILRFQGVRPEWLKHEGVPPRQLRLMAGNAWSINVAGRILLALIKCLDLCPEGCYLRDPWGEKAKPRKRKATRKLSKRSKRARH